MHKAVCQKKNNAYFAGLSGIKRYKKWTMTEIKLDLGDKIGAGHFRECFSVKGDPGLCVKKLKPNLTFFQRLHLKLLRRNFNQDEFRIYNQLPQTLKPYFNPVIQASGDYLITTRPMDYDGSHSLPVSDYGKISNAHFWNEMKKIVALFEKHNLWFFDAFQLGTNVFVQRLSEDRWVPIIVDFKRHGWRSYPAQLNLLCDSEKKKKFYRKYHRFNILFRE